MLSAVLSSLDVQDTISNPYGDTPSIANANFAEALVIGASMEM